MAFLFEPRHQDALLPGKNYGPTLILYEAKLETTVSGSEAALTNKLATVLGIVVLAAAFAAAPMPLTTGVGNPGQTVTIYPNLLFAVPLILLGALLLLYGAAAGNRPNSVGSA